jgi:hypothetical protein
MSLNAKQIKQLNTIIATAQELLKDAGAGSKAATKTAGKTAATRKRRVGKELTAFRKMLAAERANGVPVAEIAAKHGVSSAYVYQIPAGRKSSVKSATKKAAPKQAGKVAKKAAKAAATKKASKEASKKGAVKAVAGRKASGGKSAGKSSKSAAAPAAQQVAAPRFDPASI